MKTACTLLTLLSLIVWSPRPAQAQTQTQTPGASNANGPLPKVAGGDVELDYRLVAGDKLRIEVYKDPQLSQSLQIRPDGKITLPLIGDVVAAGVTTRELTIDADPAFA